MMHIGRNSAGVELGPRGYVLCQVCQVEVDDVSRETSQPYARCKVHRAPNQQEVVMTAVPKPSQAKRAQKPTSGQAAPKPRQVAKPVASAVAVLDPITLAQASLKLGVKVGRIHILIKEGRISAAHLENGWALSEGSVDAYMTGRGKRKAIEARTA